MRAQRDRLAAALLEVGEDIVDETTPANAARGRPGLAFCPTTRALALLARAGAVPEPHPSVEVLRTVNGRAFSASLGAGLPGSAFVTDRATAEAKLRAGTGPRGMCRPQLRGHSTRSPPGGVRMDRMIAFSMVRVSSFA